MLLAKNLILRKMKLCVPQGPHSPGGRQKRLQLYQNEPLPVGDFISVS